MARIAVIGSGSYGTCLALLLCSGGHEVSLWCRRKELVDEIRSSGTNARYLPGAVIPSELTLSTDLRSVVRDKDIVVGVTPSHAIQEVFGLIASELHTDTIVVNASKGLLEDTLETIQAVYQRLLPPRIAARACYVSGPTFAKEVAQQLPGAMVVAGADPVTTERIQRDFSTEYMRLYRTDDVTGTLIGGALKNVVAIACGVSDGLGFGLNARAGLITRGLAEISRIGVKLGANQATFSGLSGVGDLVLTCSGDLSRNRRVGLGLGAGKSLEQITSEMHMVAEGVKTTSVAYELSKKLSVDTPIASAMYSIIYGGKAAEQVMGALMQRRLKREEG